MSGAVPPDMAEAFMGVADSIKVAFDAADGLRADLLARGYTAASAEQVAVEFIVGFVRMITGGGKT